MTRRWRIRFAAAGVLVALYTVIFWAVGLTDTLVLHPTTQAIDVPNGRRMMFDRADGSGKRAEVWIGRTRVRRTEENLAYVLEFSPNAGRAEYGLLYGLGKWEGLPVEYWSLNYPGYGGSEGPAGLASVHASALAAYDLLAKQAAGKPIFLSGYSLGTAAALHVASKRPVAGLYLYAPPPLRELIMGKFGWWNLWLAAWPVSRGVPVELDSLRNGSHCSAPAVFVLGDRDTFVEYPYQQRVAAAYAGPKQVLTLPVNHNQDPADTHPREVRDGVLWLWDHAVLATTRPSTLPTGR